MVLKHSIPKYNDFCFVRNILILISKMISHALITIHLELYKYSSTTIIVMHLLVSNH
jgi:hypothetical protein